MRLDPAQIWDPVRDQALAALEVAAAAGSHIDPERLARILAQAPGTAGNG